MLLNNNNFDHFENAFNDINTKYKLKFFNIEEQLFNSNTEEHLKNKLKNEYDFLKGNVDLIIFHDLNDKDQIIDEIDFYIKSRKHRSCIKNSLKIRKFLVGDVLEFVYNYKNMALTFSGICISLKKKSFILPDVSLILRNIILGVGIELTLSYFQNRGYKMVFLDYRRKFFHFNKNKLYFIRNRVNQESKV